MKLQHRLLSIIRWIDSKGEEKVSAVIALYHSPDSDETPVVVGRCLGSLANISWGWCWHKFLNTQRGGGGGLNRGHCNSIGETIGRKAICLCGRGCGLFA